MAPSTLIHNACVWIWDSKHVSVVHGDVLGHIRSNCYLTVHNGYISHVSQENELPPDSSGFDLVINANMRLILPGLMDSHIHVAMFGESQYYVDLVDCYSIEELLEKIRAHLEKYPDLPWITGVNWDQTKLGRYPTRHDLAKLSTPKPIFLYRACWHIGVANDVALTIAQIIGLPTEECLKSPPGGVIEIDSRGQPTGILKERAVELIIAGQQRQGGAGDANTMMNQKMRFLREGMDVCARFGLTTVQTNDEGSLRAYQQLKQRSELPLRVFLTPVHDELVKKHDTGGISDVAAFRPACYSVNNSNSSSEKGVENSRSDERDSGQQGHRSDRSDASSMESRLLMERVKIFSDGSLGAETAAIRVLTTSPSASTATATSSATTSTDTGARNCENDTGVLVYERSVLANMVVQAYQAGYRVEIHAIGDAAAEQVMNALDDSEEILARERHETVLFCGREESCERLRHWRPILTHCQVLGADIIRRMADKGVVANVQPSFVPTDMQWVRNRISGSQLDHSYIWKSLLLHTSQHMPTANNTNSTAINTGSGGLSVAGGSDAPIETPNPFTGMYDAIVRSNKRRLKAGEEKEEVVFHPHECLSFSQALWIYTIGGAYAAAVEDSLGQIAPGYIGDLVLVDPEILRNTELLHGMLPDMVLVGGALSAVNRVAVGEGERADENSGTGAPQIEKCEQTLPYLPLPPQPISSGAAATSAQAGGVSLSNATYFPGRGGRPLLEAYGSVTAVGQENGEFVFCQPTLSFPAGLKCACILNGRYCPTC